MKVRLLPLDRVMEVNRGTLLKDVLHGTGVEFPCGGRGECGKCVVTILEGKVEAVGQHRSRLRELKLEPDQRLACMSRCVEDLVVHVQQMEVVVKGDFTPFQFEPGTGFGIAVDVGTTTLVAQLVDLATGKILAVETSLNPQKAFGDDVISRLEAAMEQGIEKMKGMIRERIGQMIGRLMRGRGRRVERVVLVGNTVMQHLFSGSDIRPLASYPFQPPDLGVRNFLPRDLEWDIACSDIRFCPSIGSFVGSDLLGAIMATGLHATEDWSLLIDLGTNGEVVAGNRDQLLCASTAAGPAFEGARISSGMLAATGAIATVKAVRGTPSFRVIGDTAARGICGSGLIDAMAVMLNEGMLGTFGEILSGKTHIPVTTGVSITAKDIQEFLLAKAAIATGVEVLMKRLGIRVDEVSRVFIAGAFGSYINPESLRRTGLLDYPPEKVNQVGNAAIMGARMLLFREPDAAGEVLRIARHVNLESDPSFQEVFVRHLAFDAG